MHFIQSRINGRSNVVNFMDCCMYVFSPSVLFPNYYDLMREVTNFDLHVSRANYGREPFFAYDALYTQYNFFVAVPY